VQRFELRSRFDVVCLTGIFLLVGGLALFTNLLWAFGLTIVNGRLSPETTADWFLVAWSSALGLIGLGICAWFSRRLYAVELDPDGSLRLVRLLGTTSISIGEIIEVDSFTAKISEEGSDPRRLRVRHTRGTVTIPFSPHLVAELRRRIPSVIRDLRPPR
jgi:hypothetical protein